MALLVVWGIPVVFLTTFLSCLAVPVPSSLVMLAAGAFVASGDLALWQTLAAAYAGAVLGDQAGFGLGRLGGGALMRRAMARPRSAALLLRAERWLASNVVPAIFFSRWLVSPLGPYLNLAGGAARIGWGRFTASAMAGEAVWVSAYVTLGAVFAARLEAVASLLGNVSGLMAAAALALALGALLLGRVRRGGGPTGRGPGPAHRRAR